MFSEKRKEALQVKETKSSVELDMLTLFTLIKGLKKEPISFYNLNLLLNEILRLKLIVW